MNPEFPNLIRPCVWDGAQPGDEEPPELAAARSCGSIPVLPCWGAAQSLAGLQGLCRWGRCHQFPGMELLFLPGVPAGREAGLGTGLGAPPGPSLPTPLSLGTAQNPRSFCRASNTLC